MQTQSGRLPQGGRRMAESLDRLIADLADYRTRRRAIDEIIARGKEAVEPLISLLSSQEEGVLWSAIRILGRIGDERAVAPLVETMARGAEEEAAAEALRRITGQDFGTDVGKWRAYLQGKGLTSRAPSSAVEVPAAEAERALDLSDEEIIKRICEGTTIGYFFHGDTWNLDVALAGGRHQRVKLLFGAKDPEGSALVVVYTECGPAVRDRWEWALRANLTLRWGSIAIRTVNRRPIFVMVRNLLRRGLNISELKKTVLSLAEKGDLMERMLTLEDMR